MSRKADFSAQSGAWLALALRDAGVRQQDLASAVGVRVSAITWWLKGRVPREEYVSHIADFFAYMGISAARVQRWVDHVKDREYDSRIGWAFRTFRVKVGASQEEAAAALRVQRFNVASWELGRNRVPKGIAKKMRAIMVGWVRSGGGR
jgi:DNA-binding transcriptional regulator YiaG